MSQYSRATRSLGSPGDPQDLTFLPINQAHSPGDSRTRRGNRSCDNCRQKKKRCQPSLTEFACLRCQQESRDCLTTHRRKKRTLRPPVVEARPDLSGSADVAPGCMSPTPTTQTPPPVGDSDSSLEDIGSIPADPCSSTPGAVSSRSGNTHQVSNTKERILSTSILDARDALDLIAVAGSTEAAHTTRSLSPGGINKYPNRSSQSFASAQPTRQPSLTSWDRFFLVRRGIIQPHEIEEYLDFYFIQLRHLFPVIPQWYSLRSRYTILANEEPVLMMSLVTIASRYHPLSGYNGQARSERIHWRSWPWVQRILQSSIWGSSAMRSFGAIAALLLFIEWHPRAINSPEDMISDCADLEIFGPAFQPHEEHGLHINETTQSHRKIDSQSITERLNMVAPAYRSNAMSWMLSSTAVALAQEIGCFEDEEVTAHTNSNQTAERIPIRKEWGFLLRNFIRLTDEALALRLRIEPRLTSISFGEIDRHLSNMILDEVSESILDLTPHMRKARELLHAWRKSQQGTGPIVPIAAWTNFKRGLDSWKTNRRVTGSQNIELSLSEACLKIEYHYIRLCGLSPAAYMFETSSRANPTNSYIMSLSIFAEEATRASVNMLEVAVEVFSSPEPFQYASVKCWLYTVCASLYLLKVTLKMERVENDLIALIMKVIGGIKQNAPDDIHMSRRYATLLEVLVSAALRTSQSGTTQSNRANTSNYSSSYPLESSSLGMDQFDFGEEWIYDPKFWETLPDMVGLNDMPSLMQFPS